MPVLTAFVRWRPSSGWTSVDAADRRPHPVRHGRAGPLRARARRARPPAEPERLAELLDERVELELGPLGAAAVVVGARLVDLVLQLDDPRLVLAARLTSSRTGPAAPPTSVPPISSNAWTSTPGG